VKAIGTNTDGATFWSTRELAITRKIDTTAVPITIVGSVVTSRFARYSASRVALPAMNCALTAAEQIIAMMTAGSVRVWDEVIRTVGDQGMRVADAPEPLDARRTRSWYHPPSPRRPKRGFSGQAGRCGFRSNRRRWGGNRQNALKPL
jgi:hypothetical protein